MGVDCGFVMCYQSHKILMSLQNIKEDSAGVIDWLPEVSFLKIAVSVLIDVLTLAGPTTQLN